MATSYTISYKIMYKSYRIAVLILSKWFIYGCVTSGTEK